MLFNIICIVCNVGGKFSNFVIGFAEHSNPFKVGGKFSNFVILLKPQENTCNVGGKFSIFVM